MSQDEGNFLKTKARRKLRDFQDKQKEYLKDGVSCLIKTRISDELSIGSQTGWESFSA